MAEIDKDETEHVFNLPRMNTFFAISGILLTLTVIWMIYADYARPWKRYQSQFNRLEIEKTKSELKETLSAEETAELKQLRADLAQADKDEKQHRADLKKLEKQLKHQKGLVYRADQEWRFARAVYDVDKYNYEVAVGEHQKGLEKRKASLDKQAARIAQLDDRVKKLKAEQAGMEAAIAKIEARRTDLASRVSTATERATLLEGRLKRIEPSLTSAILNAPLLDFMKPTLKVNQIMVPDLTFDVNFAGAPRVDRCTTCHLAIDKKGYEDAPQPFRTHPRLDTFVSANSVHGMDKFGCTTCHGGSGWATDFVNAAHTPSSEDQEKEWRKKYGWHELHMWDYPMYKKSQVEASCLKCHYEQQPDIPGAPRLNRGMELIEKSGCYGCHNIRGYEHLRKVGPSLERIGEKVTPDWVNKWVADPTSFARYARMPRFFGVAPEPTPALVNREKTEIAALATFIMSRSSADRPAYAAPPPGSAASGRELVETIGCRGCHVVGEPPDTLKSRSSPMRFGPDLSATGSKLSPQWVFAWLKDPKHYWEKTRMPNLRLADQEAADITAYLTSLRNPAFEALPVNQADPKVLDQIALEYLQQKMTLEAANQQVASMNPADKELYVGERMVSRYGCFGCHDIKGFENAQQIGTGLSEEGSKKPGQLDFGLIHDLPHTTHAWITQKVLDPRIYDTGRVKKLEERLKMPRFGFSQDEADAIATTLLGFTKEKVPAPRRVQFTPEQALVQKGVWLTEERNCIGCHIIGDRGGAIRQVIADPGQFPPPLTGEGAKVRSEWLFSFLKAPYPIRPWLHVRMPTFGFTDDEVNTVIRYFASDGNGNYFVTDPHQGSANPELLAAGQTLFTQFQCLKCHDQVKPVVSAADRAPDLGMASNRLRSDWIVTWLRDPQKVQPGTRMPTFFYEGVSPNKVVFGGDTEKQLDALRTYVLTLQPQFKSGPRS